MSNMCPITRFQKNLKSSSRARIAILALWPGAMNALWRRNVAGRISAPTEKALKLIAKGLTPYAAAKKVGIALSTIYRSQKRLKGPAARQRS
jgi:hypothetical protein